MSGLRPASVPFLDIRQLSTRGRPAVDLQAQRGECICILGKSGSGKSVFLRLVADLDPARARCCSTAWTATPARPRVAPARDLPGGRARMVGSPRWPSTFPMTCARCCRLAAEVGLPGDILQADIARLSTGERQRLALLRSLARKPAVLLLDEPTASLDHATTLAVEACCCAQLAKRAWRS
jgi:ABC-type iron transport system FetAB ATPase subunit